MPPSIMLPFASTALVVLALVFVWNVRSGLRTGTIYIKSAKYSLAEEPYLFWFGVVVYSILAVGLLAGACFGIWAWIDLT